MTKETAKKAMELLCQIEDAQRVLTYIDKQERAWFGSVLSGGQWQMPAESVSGARRCYQKIKEWAEAELEKL